MFKDFFYSALGATSFTAKKIKGVVDELVKSGEMSKEEGEKLYASIKTKLNDEGKEFEKLIEDSVKKIINKLNLATKDDLNDLRKEFENLKKKF